MTSLKLFANIAVMAAAFGFAPKAAAPSQLPVNLSGYEFLLGTSCTIDGQPATCGVEFGGWTGGGGQVANGWTPFPGTDEGLWKASVDRTGTAAFGGTSNLVGGSFYVLFTNGTVISGKVDGGTVNWPATSTADIGCGTGVAKVSVDLSFKGGRAGTFQGCLHDLPAGSVIPPKIWGTLE